MRYVILSVIILATGFGLGWMAKDQRCSDTTPILVPCDTIPPVTGGWVIEGDSVRFQEVMYYAYRDVSTERWYSWKGYNDTLWQCEVPIISTHSLYADRSLAESELCRRLERQRDSAQAKIEKICEPIVRVSCDGVNFDTLTDTAMGKYDPTYFWWSDKMYEFTGSYNWTIINGKRVRYTICSGDTHHGARWGDMKYLGKGRMRDITYGPSGKFKRVY